MTNPGQCSGCGIMESMKSKPEMIEGPGAFKRFESAMKVVLSIPHAEIQRRIEEERQRSAANPNRRGPKRRVKLSASSDHAEES
jgi:hypothetical protein